MDIMAVADCRHQLCQLSFDSSLFVFGFEINNNKKWPTKVTGLFFFFCSNEKRKSSISCSNTLLRHWSVSCVNLSFSSLHDANFFFLFFSSLPSHSPTPPPQKITKNKWRNWRSSTRDEIIMKKCKQEKKRKKKKVLLTKMDVQVARQTATQTHTQLINELIINERGAPPQLRIDKNATVCAPSKKVDNKRVKWATLKSKRKRKRKRMSWLLCVCASRWRWMA